MTQVSVVKVGVTGNTLNNVCSRLEMAKCCKSVTNTRCSFIALYRVVARRTILSPRREVKITVILHSVRAVRSLLLVMRSLSCAKFAACCCATVSFCILKPVPKS